LAKCFRDEDGRKDRQPEFTQIDLEMAFVSWGDALASSTVSSDQWRIGGSEVRDVVEDIIRKVWLEVEDVTLPGRFEVITYHDAMTRVSLLSSCIIHDSYVVIIASPQYGSDKPDTRFGLEVSNLRQILVSAIFRLTYNVHSCRM
jgi:aspartyl-tRNA synthetase